MRSFLFPSDGDKTTCVNFDHVAYARVCSDSIELYFIGVESPMVLTKSAQTLTLVAKGMDLSDNSKDLVNTL